MEKGKSDHLKKKSNLDECKSCYVYDVLQERIKAYDKLIIDLQNASYRSLKKIDRTCLN